MTRPNFGKAIGGSFAVGGIFGIICQLLVMAYSMTPLYAAGFSTIAVLVTMGLIGGVLFAVGLYPKIEGIGGMGAILPFCGLAAALSGMFYGVKKETGSSGIAAKTIFIDLILKVVLLATALSVCVALLVHFTGFGSINTVSYAPGGLVVTNVGAPLGAEQGPPNGVPVDIAPMSLIWAFLIAGVLCAVCQAVIMATKTPLPIFLVALFTLGALLCPLGIDKVFVTLAGGGFQVLIIDAGEAVVSTFCALLQGGTPGPMPFLSVLCLFASLYVIGIACGSIRAALDEKNQ